MAKPDKQKEYKRVAKVAKAGRRSRTGGKFAGLNKHTPVEASPLVITTVGASDLINGNVATGHNVLIGDATFGVIEEGRQLTLVAAASGELSKFVGKAPHVFIKVSDLVKDEYTPALTGMWGAQQIAMWQHIGDTLCAEGLEALEERLQRDRTARFDAINAERAAAEKAAMHVGANVEVWDRAVAGSDDIAAAFEAMTSDKQVEIRFGREVSFGVVLGFFFDQLTDGINVHVGHVGEKSEQAGKIVGGAHLRCFGSTVPETLSHTILASHFGGSVKMIHELVMGLDRVKGGHDAMMSGMYHAVKRIVAERKNKVVPIKSVKPVLTAVPTSLAPVSEVKVDTSAIPAEEIKAAAKPLTSRAEAIKMVIEMMPIEVAARLIASKVSTDTLLATAAAYKEAKEAKSA